MVDAGRRHVRRPIPEAALCFLSQHGAPDFAGLQAALAVIGNSQDEERIKAVANIRDCPEHRDFIDDHHVTPS